MSCIGGRSHVRQRGLSRCRSTALFVTHSTSAMCQGLFIVCAHQVNIISHGNVSFTLVKHFISWHTMLGMVSQTSVASKQSWFFSQSLDTASDMHSSKRVKLTMSTGSVTLLTDLKVIIMGYYKDLLIPGIRFSKYKEELMIKARDFQERIHHYLNSYDMPDHGGCYCEFESATDFLLMCYYDTIDGYMPGQLRCHHCVEYYAQYDN
jgi:hypothetical protein